MIFGITGLNNQNRDQFLNSFQACGEVNYFGDTSIACDGMYFKKLLTVGNENILFTALLYDERDAHYLDTLHFPALAKIPRFLQHSLHGGFAAVAVSENEVALATDRHSIGRFYYTECQDIIIFSDSLGKVARSAKVNFNPVEFASEISMILPVGGKTNYSNISVLNQGGAGIFTKVAGIYTASASNTIEFPTFKTPNNMESSIDFFAKKFNSIACQPNLLCLVDGSLQSLIIPAVLKEFSNDFHLILIDETHISPKLNNLLNGSGVSIASFEIGEAKKLQIEELFQIADSGILTSISELAFWEHFASRFAGNKLCLPFNAEIITGDYSNKLASRFKAALNTKHVSILKRYLIKQLPEIFSHEINDLISREIQSSIEREFEIFPSISESGIENWVDTYSAIRGKDAYFAPILKILQPKLQVYTPFLDLDTINFILNMEAELKRGKRFISKILNAFLPHIDSKYLSSNSVFDLPKKLARKTFLKSETNDGLINRYKKSFYYVNKELIMDMLHSGGCMEAEFYNTKEVKNIINNYQYDKVDINQLDVLLTTELFRKSFNDSR